MKSAWAYLFEKRQAFNLDHLIADFAQEQISLPNPNSRRITMLTKDGMPVKPDDPSSGNQIEVSKPELAQLIATEAEVPFQWWFDSGRDLFCSIENPNPYMLVQKYDLSIDFGNLQRTYRALANRFLKGIHTGASLGFVMDPSAINEDFDWREYLLGGDNPPPVAPALAALPTVFFVGQRQELASHEYTDLGSFTVVEKRDSPLPPLSTMIRIEM